MKRENKYKKINGEEPLDFFLLYCGALKRIFSGGIYVMRI